MEEIITPIKNRFIHCANKGVFLTQRENGVIGRDSIVFIAQEKLIWTQTDSNDDFYDCSNHADIRELIEDLSERLGLLEDEVVAFKALIETDYALKTEVASSLTEAKKYADGAHTAIPTTEINALFN